MKRQIGILMAVWLITFAFPAHLFADTSYLLVQGPFGSNGSEVTYKWQVNYPTGYLVTAQDLLNAVLGTPIADGTFSDPVFGERPYFIAGNSSRGAGYLEFFGSLLTLSFTLNSTPVTTNDATPDGTSTVGWNYYVAGGSGAYGGPYANTGVWLVSDDGQATRYLSNGSYDGWVYGNTGYDAEGDPATTGSTTAVINDASKSNDPSDFSAKSSNDVFKLVNVTLEGKYTVLLSATATGATLPPGFGYATMSVYNKAGAIVAGKLPDGESFTASGYLLSGSAARTQFVIDQDLSYPSVRDHGSSGFLFGTLTFETQTGASNFNGTLEWVKPQQTSGAYPAPIDTNLDVIGSVYTPPTTTRGVLPGFTRGTLALSDTSGLILSGSSHLFAGQLVVPHPKDNLTVTINPATGIFAGSFDYPGKTPRLTDFGGVLFQDQAIGAGFFIGPNRGGTVTLSP